MQGVFCVGWLWVAEQGCGLQDMLKQWICATTGKVLFTPKGRAFNRAAPSLGSTASTAFLSLLYGQSHSRYISQEKSDRYTCFARSQVGHPSLTPCLQIPRHCSAQVMTAPANSQAS